MNLTALKWMKSYAVFPRASCEGHCAATVGSYLYVFGGVEQDVSDEILESNFLFKLHIDTQIWLKVEATGDTPEPRCNATLCAVGPVLYLFGGLSHCAGWLNDFFSFDTESNVWQKIDGKGLVPSPRDKLASTPVGSDIYFFGGFGPKNSQDDISKEDEGDDDEYTDDDSPGEIAVMNNQKAANFTWFNDLYTYNTQTRIWSKPMQMNLGAPTPRAAHTLCSYNHRLVIFGGRDIDGRCNDVHVFNADTRKWDMTLNVSGKTPEPRSFHSAFCADSKMFVFGGRGSQNQHFSDLHILDLDKWQWLQPEVTGEAPAGRSTHSCNLIRDTVIVFGGSADFNEHLAHCETFYTDTYLLDIGYLLSTMKDKEES